MGVGISAIFQTLTVPSLEEIRAERVAKVVEGVVVEMNVSELE